MRISTGFGPLITFVECLQQRAQRVNSTAVTASDTAIRQRSLRNLDASLVAGGAGDHSHLVRAPKALGVHRTREESPDEVILIEAEEGVQRMTMCEMFDSFEALKVCVG